MKKFEYTTIEVNTYYGCGAIDKTFNSLGKEGWELVTAASENETDYDGDTNIRYTFKREIE